MIEEILSAEVVAVEAFGDVADVPLFPEEERVLRDAVEKRRREFTTARHCARIALARLGMPAVPILPGHRGAPTWPDGVVGSMTHCDGYRASAVARRADVLSVGVDCEPHDALPHGVIGTVARPDDRAHLAGLADGPHWDRLLFSAKESVYKAWFPLTGLWLDFHDVSLIITPGDGTGEFTARFHVPGPTVGGERLTRFTGRWLVRDGLVATAIVIPAPAGAEPPPAG